MTVMKTPGLSLTAALAELYNELGDPQQIEDILKAFYGKMAKDLMLGFFFSGKDLQKIINQQKNFLLRSMGAAKTYSGKAPARAHTKIAPILKGHFDRRILLLRQTLNEFGVSQKGIETWLAFEEQFRSALVKDEKGVST